MAALSRGALVAGAKVLLPLAALVLLSTLFLVARGPGDAIPFARLDALAREPRLEAPRLAGVAPDGTALTLAADRLVPLAGRPDAFAVLAPRLEAARGGATLGATAGRGEADGPSQRLTLDGGVRVETSTGLRVDLPALAVDLRTGRMEAAGPVEARAPFGRISAGGLAVEAQDGASAARVVFNGGVRLLYEGGGRTDTP